ncbi:conserved hypothetical protein [Gammaproteobacteria bacterium]
MGEGKRPLLVWNKDNGWGEIPTRKLAIVGSHPATRENAPYDDPEWEIWLYNEAPQKTEVYKRWDACLQLHKPEVYSSLENWVNKGHWEWLQKDHGKVIWMQEVDPKVPNSVRYPIEGVLDLVPYRYLRSSPALALALAIYLGYEEISLYGNELSSNTEYAYQATNLAFWIGFAHGRGIKLNLECWQSEFNQAIYGYEGELQIDAQFYEKRFDEYERAWTANDKTMTTIKNRLDAAMLERKYDKVGQLTIELQNAALATGETAGAVREAERYMRRSDPISRQEFERVSAQAQIDGDALREKMLHAGGKCEYVWNVWRQTGRMEALNQLRGFTREKVQFAYDMGAQLGIWKENLLYMSEYDKRVTALGGQRAVGQVVESFDR